MRLKALKRAELDKKLLLIQEVAGKADLRVAALDMDSDFDAAAHDRRMAELFDDEYYAEGTLLP
jgi:protein KRI1